MKEIYTAARPIKILVSACLAGDLCGVDGSSNGEYPWIKKLIALPNVHAVRFCPEQFSLGTPRDLPDIHGGNGFDVLDGNARVVSDKGADMTDAMIAGAKEMLRIAKEKSVDLAVMMDMSAACGSHVISDGCRLDSDRAYQQGPGVSTALLRRNGIRVVSQRDFRSLELLWKQLDSDHIVDVSAIDHRETEWYRNHFEAN